MSVHQPHADVSRGSASARVAAGQTAVHNLRARTSIVAVEGVLRLRFRDHSLAWLGDAVPATSITLHEGERFVTPQHGVVSISALHPRSATFVLARSEADNKPHAATRQAVRHLTGLIKTWRGRAA